MAFKTHISNSTGNQPGQVTTGLTAAQNVGVHDVARGDFLVTGTAGLGVSVAKGEAFVEASAYVYGTMDQRIFSVASSASESVAITSNSSGNARIDIICIKVDPGTSPGTQGSLATTIVAVAGTPAASPTPPAVPSNHLLLAYVAVANGASVISNNEITDARIQATPLDKTGGWLYAQNYSPTYQAATTIRFSSQDLTSIFAAGEGIRLKQGGSYKYFRIVAISFSTHTDLTITGNGVYTLTNAAITDFYHSRVRRPIGLPVSMDGVWWEELGRTVLGSSGDSISVASIQTRKYLKVLFYGTATGGTVTKRMRFNNDSGSNYVRRISINGAADVTNTTQDNINFGAATDAAVVNAEAYITNVATAEKLVVIHTQQGGTAGASNIPDRAEVVAKWTNTSDAITRIDIYNDSTGDFAAGSEVVILGHN